MIKELEKRLWEILDTTIILIDRHQSQINEAHNTLKKIMLIEQEAKNIKVQIKKYKEKRGVV